MPPLLKRVLLSLLLAGLTFWMSLEMVFTLRRDDFVHRYNTPSGRTRHLILDKASANIEAFHLAKGHLPRTPEEVQAALNFKNYLRTDFSRDAWGHPLIYRPDQSAFQLLSYGHDGTPGGIGLDADIELGSQGPDNRPTFWQFLTYPETEFHRTVCLLLALFTFFFYLYIAAREAKRGRKFDSVSFLLSAVVTTSLSVYGASLLATAGY